MINLHLPRLPDPYNHIWFFAQLLHQLPQVDLHRLCIVLLLSFVHFLDDFQLLSQPVFTSLPLLFHFLVLWFPLYLFL